MFKLTQKEWEFIRSQNATASENEGNRSQIVSTSEKSDPSSQNVMMGLPKNRTAKYLPYAFTEHGVTMLASILKSKMAIGMNIAIVRAFIAMRHFANHHKGLAEQMHELRTELQNRIGEHDVQLAAIYDALENLLDKKEDENVQKREWIERERIGFKK